MAGEELRAGLDDLVRDFDEVAIPPDGRYARRPAVADETGLVSVPPDKPGLPPALVFGIGLGVAIGLAVGALGPGPTEGLTRSRSKPRLMSDSRFSIPDEGPWSRHGPPSAIRGRGVFPRPRMTTGRPGPGGTSDISRAARVARAWIREGLVGLFFPMGSVSGDAAPRNVAFG